MLVAASLNNSAELGLERGTTDQESVDVRLCDKVGAVASVG